MISSPCKNCYRYDKSKDECIADCDIIQKAQRELMIQGQDVSTTKDHTDSVRLRLLIKTESTRTLCVHILE